MSSKFLMYLLITAGSVIGGYVPVLFGASLISFTSILGSGIGSLIGIYLSFKLAKLF